MEISNVMSVQLLDATHKMQKEHKTKQNKNTKYGDVLDTLRQDGRAVPRYRCTWTFNIFMTTKQKGREKRGGMNNLCKTHLKNLAAKLILQMT
jgi:hypothetical protein